MRSSVRTTAKDCTYFLAVAFVAAGVTIGVVETAEHGTVAEVTPEEIRGSAFGFLAAIQSFGNLVASGIAGLLWTLVSPLAAFLFAAAGMIVATVTGLAARQHTGKNERSTFPTDKHLPE